MRGLPNIGLCGKSGSGKSTVASYLADEFGYTHVKTGTACREIALMLFADDSKTTLNAVTDALRSIQPDVWITAALRNAPANQVLVVDSQRFLPDYVLLREKQYSLWRVEAPLAVRVARLTGRGQEYNPPTDEEAEAETELDGMPFDVVLHNNPDIVVEDMHRQVRSALGVV
jgi:cytidylate kinase